MTAPSDVYLATLGTSYRITFLMSVLTFLCWFVTLTLARLQSTRAERELRELRERGLDLGVLS